MPILGKAVQYSRTGHPPDVVEVVELEQPEPGPGEILCKVEAAPIAPSHILALSGRYGTTLDLPAVPGNDALATVIGVGNEVDHLAEGDRVMLPPGSGGWRQYAAVRAEDVTVTFPPGGDPLQLSMLLANPPTAYLMLTQIVQLQPGDWIIQNAANSAVGQYLVQLACHFGWRTICVVRRDGLDGQLRSIGADRVIVDSPDLAELVAKATGGAEIRIAIDAVAGDATARLASCLPIGGTVVNYGLLSGQPCQISPSDIIFRDISLTGFWLYNWLTEKSDRADRVRMYELLSDLVVKGVLHAAVEATYPLSRAREAVAHAMRENRSGKILFTPQVEA